MPDGVVDEVPEQQVELPVVRRDDHRTGHVRGNVRSLRGPSRSRPPGRLREVRVAAGGRHGLQREELLGEAGEPCGVGGDVAQGLLVLGVGPRPAQRQLDLRREQRQGGAEVVGEEGEDVTNADVNAKIVKNGKRGIWAEQSSALVAGLLDDVRAGDCVMVKGSLGSRMGPVVEALKSRWPQSQREDV